MKPGVVSTFTSTLVVTNGDAFASSGSPLMWNRNVPGVISITS